MSQHTDEPFVNNVTRFLDSQKIVYRVHRYDYAAGIHSAVQVAGAIGLPPAQVFKTLIAVSPNPAHKPLVAIIPGPANLDLKALAQSVGGKKVKMATHAQAEALTSMQTGGITPLALIKQGFRFFLDQTARSFETIAVSAGERGVNLELSTAVLEKLLRPQLLKLSDPEEAVSSSQ